MENENLENKLQENALSFWQLVFYAIVIMFPATAFAITGSTAMAYSGPVAPLSFLVAGIILMFAIVAVYYYTIYVANAGGYYKFVEVSVRNPYLSKTIGLMQLLYYISIMWFTSILSGWLLWTGFETMFNVSIPLWVVILVSLIGPLGFLFVGYRKISLSGNLAIVVGATEIAIFAVIAVLLILKTPYNSLSYFNVYNSWGGFSGFFAAVVVGGFLTYAGYGSIVMYGEEAKTPHSTLKKAIVTAAVIIVIYETFLLYSVVAAAGPTLSTGLQFFAPGFYYTKLYLGLTYLAIGFAVILFDQIMAPIFNGNQAARIIYALARDKVIPEKLSKVHKKYRSPYLAVILVTILTVIGVLLLITLSVYFYGIDYGLFVAWVIPGTILSVIWMIYHAVVNETLPVMMKKIGKLNVLTHIILPTVSSVFFIIALYYSVQGIAWPVSISFIILVVWVIASLVYIHFKKNQFKMDELKLKLSPKDAV